MYIQDILPAEDSWNLKVANDWLLGPLKAFYNPLKKTWEMKYEYRSKASGKLTFNILTMVTLPAYNVIQKNKTIFQTITGAL
jgi:hypothetical protein